MGTLKTEDETYLENNNKIANNNNNNNNNKNNKIKKSANQIHNKLVTDLMGTFM